MLKVQTDVLNFMLAMEQDAHPTPSTDVSQRVVELRQKLHEEEFLELNKAVEEKDLVGIADGICDLIYVIVGTANVFGINLEPVWNEVQRTNMLKSTGPVREDGKRLKPEGWEPPDIAGILRKQGADV